jgi:hypothetical protein
MKRISQEFLVLHELTMFVRQCARLQRAPINLATWLVLYVAGMCSTSHVATRRTALQYVVSLPVQRGNLVAVAPPRRPRAVPRAARASRCVSGHHRLKFARCRDGIYLQPYLRSVNGGGDVWSDSGLEHCSSDQHDYGTRRFGRRGGRAGRYCEIYICVFLRARVSSPRLRALCAAVDLRLVGSQIFKNGFNQNIGAWNTASLTTLSRVCAASAGACNAVLYLCVCAVHYICATTNLSLHYSQI